MFVLFNINFNRKIVDISKIRTRNTGVKYKTSKLTTRSPPRPISLSNETVTNIFDSGVEFNLKNTTFPSS